MRLSRSTGGKSICRTRSFSASRRMPYSLIRSSTGRSSRAARPTPAAPAAPDGSRTSTRPTPICETHVRGIDVDTRYRIPATGVYTVGLNGTYFLKYEIQNPDGSFSDVNGMVSPITNGNGGVIPRWRHYAYVDWKLAPWNLTLAEQYQSHYDDILGNCPGAQPRKVSAYSVLHFSNSYTGLYDKNLRITFGVRNLMDRQPPYTNGGGLNYFLAGYDPGYVDPRGRTFLLSATYKFM